MSSQATRRLTRFVFLSIAAAVATIALKATAWLLTGSVGFLSDAAESIVNVVGALVALIAVRVSVRPPDDDHTYGHEKAEYLSAGAEGALILAAAVGIACVAVARLLDPQPLSDVGVGVAVSAVAAGLNLIVATLLIRVGREQRSITLEADGRHLMTDVWTSIGVIVGVIAVLLTGWERLDPIIALLVALNIVRTGVQLLGRSAGGLMDHALGPAEQAEIQAVLDAHREDGVEFHALRTRQAGRRAFVSLHLLVPGAWTVQQGHDLAERVERDLRERLPYATVFTHVEPREDAASFEDVSLDRSA
ncbi:MAG: cation diffusion facilitator family transporter [Thermoleophilaceae bacterium]